MIIVLTLISSICLYSKPLPNLICLTLVVTWLAFGQLPLVWDKTVDQEYSIDCITFLFIVVAVFVGVTMAVTSTARV